MDHRRDAGCRRRQDHGLSWRPAPRTPDFTLRPGITLPSMDSFLVLQHIACEPPAAFEDELLAWGAAVHRVELDDGDPLPDWRDFAGIIVMGGPMGAYEDDRLPWLTAEKRLIGEAVRAGTPFWGVCLGAQLLAAGLGARAFPGPGPRSACCRFASPRRRGSIRCSPRCPTSSSRCSGTRTPTTCPRARSAWPAQPPIRSRPSPSTTPTRCSSTSRSTPIWPPSWGEVPAYAQSLERLLGPGALPRLIEEVGRHQARTTAQARGMFAAWLQHVVGLERSPDAARDAQAL